MPDRVFLLRVEVAQNSKRRGQIQQEGISLDIRKDYMEASDVSAVPTYWVFLSCPVQPVLSLWNVRRTVLETVGNGKLGQSVDIRGETKKTIPCFFQFIISSLKHT